jgi:hypothetical protein
MTAQPSTTTTSSPVRVEYQITAAEMLEASRMRLLSRDTLRNLFGGTRRRAPSLGRVALALNCMFAGVLLFAAGAAWLGAAVNPLFFALEVVPAAFLLLLLISLRNTSTTHLRRHEGHPMFQQPALVEVDDRGVRSTRATSRYELEWSGALRLTETANLLMILDTEPRALVIPKRVLTEAQRREVHRLAREHIRA